MSAPHAGPGLELLHRRRERRESGRSRPSPRRRISARPAEVPGGAWIVQARDPQGAAFAMVRAGR